MIKESKKPKGKENKYTKENFRKFFCLSSWTYKQIFTLAPLDTITILIFSILTASSPIASSFFNAKILDELIKLVQTYQNRSLFDIININQPYFRLLLITAFIQLLNYTFRRTVRYLRMKFRIVHFQKQRYNLDLKLAQLDVAKFEDNQIHNAIMRAQDNLWKIRDFVDMSIDFVTELTGTVISAAIIFQYSWILGTYLIISSVPSAIVALTFIKKFYEFYDGNTENFRRRGWTSWALTSEHQVKQNRVSGANPYLIKIFEKVNNYLVTTEHKFRLKEYKFDILISLLDKLNSILIPIIFLGNVLSGRFSIGDFNFYSGRAFDIPSRFDTIISDLSSLFDDSMGIEYVKNIFDLKNDIVSGQKRIDYTRPNKIEFKNVSFKYPKSKQFALKDLSITIEPNDEIAIVGENGAGKSTMIKLLLRLFDPLSGDIYINNINIKDIDLETYYKSIGVLFQDYSLYGMLSVRENITIATPREFSPKDLTNASRNAEAEEFITKLDNKYNTILSKNFEGGTNLSSGQEQKIVLARMFYRNSPILILDEPTASIDPVSEYNIFKRIYKFMTDKTVIIISHRFSTVRNAQKIYVLDKGRIVEQGSHRELMALNGKYADAFNKQAEGYTKED